LFWTLPLPHALLLRIARKAREAFRALKARIFGKYLLSQNLYPDAGPTGHREGMLRILIFDWSTPKPDIDSASIDTVNYFRLFQALGFDVTFLPHDLRHQQKYTQSLQEMGVQCLYWPHWSSVNSYLKRHGAEFDLVMLQRAHGAIEYIGSVRKHCPRAKVIFNTVDLHYVREMRQAELEGSRVKFRRALKTKAIEHAIMARSDATIVISQQEMEAVKEEWPQINVVPIPFIREAAPTTKPSFDKREDILFLGGFLHMPNVDAVHYFVEQIWPLLRQTLPDVRLHIVGSNMPKEIEQLGAIDGIVAVGYVEDLAPILDRCRVSIAPLRYGAGIKGKIGTSLSHGVPCVATPLAVEGMGLVDGVNVRIGEDPLSFANALVDLYQDKQAWERIAKNGLELSGQKYSFNSGLARLRTLIQENLRMEALVDVPRE
jgi:glycosyltransferase involved in cell wall biosynthesis